MRWAHARGKCLGSEDGIDAERRDNPCAAAPTPRGAKQEQGAGDCRCGGTQRRDAVVRRCWVGRSDHDDPPTADTQFLIASITKTFTAVMVMALRDEGKVTLDDTIDQHLPDSMHGGITIRQMLSHTTGMQREPVGDVWDTLTFPDREQLVAGWNEAERILKPHYVWHYSNLVYSMLGELVARLDGREWVDSLQSRILDPLEMRRTTLGLTSPPSATGYYVPPFSDVPIAEPLLDSGAMVSAGGLASTANDLAIWAGFVTDPDADILNPDTLEEMCRPQIVADLDRWQAAHSLGFQLVRSGDRVYVGHTGGMPGHITGVFVERASGTCGIALMNATSAPDPATLAIGLATHVSDNDPARPGALAARQGGARGVCRRHRPVVLRRRPIYVQRQARPARGATQRASRPPAAVCLCPDR